MKIIRTDFSAYFPSDFAAREKNTFKELELGSYIPFNEWKKHDLDQGVVLITNTQTDFSKLAPELLAKTKLIVHPNSGYDNFDPEWVDQQKFPIIVGHEIRAQAVAEYIISSLFQRIGQLPQHQSWSKTRQWPRHLFEYQTALIIGHGHIGQKVEKTLQSLGVKIRLFDPYKNQYKLELNQAQLVIMACGLNPTSQHLIDRAFLKELPKGFTLVNAARGGLVKTNDLIDALKKDSTAFAYLDVFEKEPVELEQYASLENLHCTSHIAGVFDGLNEKILAFETSVLQNFMRLDPKKFAQLYADQSLHRRRHKGFLI